MRCPTAPFIILSPIFWFICIHKTKKVGESDQPNYTPMFLMKSMAKPLLISTQHLTLIWLGVENRGTLF